MSDRCYLRGTSPLGVFNTVIGCLFNRVLVQMKDTETGRVLGSYFDKATKHPPENDGELKLRTRTSNIPKAIVNTIWWSWWGLKKNLFRIRASGDPFIDKLHELWLVIEFFPDSVVFHYHQCRGPTYTEEVMEYISAEGTLGDWRRARVQEGYLDGSLPKDMVMVEGLG